MESKKGFLLGEVSLKLVIAVICIGFLAYFLFSLYYSNVDSKNLELAKESLNFLEQEMAAGHAEVEIFNPKGWKITSFGSSEEKPNACSNFGWENCICFYDPDAFFKVWTDKVDEVNSLGTCIESDFVIEEYIEIENPPIKVNYNEKTIK